MTDYKVTDTQPPKSARTTPRLTQGTVGVVLAGALVYVLQDNEAPTPMRYACLGLMALWVLWARKSEL